MHGQARRNAPDAQSAILELASIKRQLKALESSLNAFEPHVPPRGRATAAWIRAIQKARRRREMIFGPELFADPAWDLLLELFAAELEQVRVSVSDACNAAAVPATTALRWIHTLQDTGWITRSPDPLDRRRIHLALTPRGSSKMNEYFNGGGNGSPL